MAASRRLLAIAGVMLCAHLQAAAQAPVVGTRQRGGTYVEPPAAVDPIYVPAAPEGGGAPGPQQPAVTLHLTLDVPLRGGGDASLGRSSQGASAASPTLQAALRWVPWRDSHWFAQLTLFRYVRGDRQQAWHPDFTYAFGYEDWRPGTWSLVYANYAGTRFDPDRAAGEGRFHFPNGQWTLSRRFLLPPLVQPVFLVGDGDHALCGGNLHLMPRYVEFSTGGERSGKASASLSCRYTRPEGWYADFAVYAYPRRSQQQPWDPDFSYGFGYEHAGPGRVTVRYGNYSGNRFPGRARGAGEGALRSGSVSVTWSGEW